MTQSERDTGIGERERYWQCSCCMYLQGMSMLIIGVVITLH